MMNGSAFILYIKQYFMVLFQFRITISTWSLYYCVEPAMLIGNFAAALITNRVCLLFVIKQDSSRPFLY